MNNAFCTLSLSWSGTLHEQPRHFLQSASYHAIDESSGDRAALHFFLFSKPHYFIQQCQFTINRLRCYSQQMGEPLQIWIQWLLPFLLKPLVVFPKVICSIWSQSALVKGQSCRNFPHFWEIDWLLLLRVLCPPQEYFTCVEASPLPVKGFKFSCHTCCDTGYRFCVLIWRTTPISRL